MNEPSTNGGDVYSKLNIPPFFVYGGWCPNLTTLVSSNHEDIEEKSNFEDVSSGEEVHISSQFKAGLLDKITCGIPEQFFASATIEWGGNGLFLLKCQFTSDWGCKEDISSTLSEEDRRTLCQNIIYKKIKEYHHIHTHHDKEHDNLLSLKELGVESNSSEFTFQAAETKERVIKHVYTQYSLEKPSNYTASVMKLLEDKEPTQSQLEEAIRILYTGMGEASFGIAFLGMHGQTVFTEASMYREHIKMESSLI